MDDRVVGALQERRIDRDHRPHALGRDSRRERRGVRFGDADVEEPIRPLFLEYVRAGPRRHRRRDGDKVRVLGGQLRQRVAEYFGPLWKPWIYRSQLSGFRVVRGAGVILLQVGLREREAFALFGDHMDEARALERLHDVERVQHLLDVVPVDRPEVAEAQLLEQHARRPEVLDALFDVLGKIDELLAADHVRRALDHVLDALAHPHAEPARDHRAEVLADRAYVGGDRHAVVIEDDDDVAAPTRVAGVVQRLVRKAARHRAITDDRQDLIVLALQVARGRHAEGGGKGRPRVTGAELVVLALIATQKAG